MHDRLGRASEVRIFPALGVILAIQAAQLGVFVFLHVISGGGVFFLLPDWVGVVGAAALVALVVGGSRLVRQPLAASVIAGGGLVGTAVVVGLVYRPDASSEARFYIVGTIALSIVGLVLLIRHVRHATAASRD